MSRDRFKRRALRRGYKVDEVDEFLDRAEATLAGEHVNDPVTSEDVRDIVFRTRWGGYDEWQVDLHLDRLERELADLAEGKDLDRTSNGFPALPPAAHDRDDRRALPPGQSAAEYASSQSFEQFAGASGIGGFAAVPPQEAFAANLPPVAPTYGGDGVSRAAEANVGIGVEPGASPTMARAYANGHLAAQEAQTEAPERYSHVSVEGRESFADLGSPSDYEDPFANHTPKPSFSEHFSSSLSSGQQGSLGPQGLNGPAESRQSAVDAIAADRTAYTASSAPPAQRSSEPSAMFPATTYGSGVPSGYPSQVVPETGTVGSADQRYSGFADDAQSPTIGSVAGGAFPDPYGGRHGKEMTVEIPAYGGQPSPFTHDDKAKLVELRSGFTTRRFGSGYDPHEVDRFFDAVAVAMDGQATTQITDSEFDPSQFTLVQHGYFEDEVETALSHLQELFSRRYGA